MYNEVPMVACHHCAQMKKFHNGPWLFVLLNHLGPSLVKKNIAIFQVNQKWLFIMFIVHVYTTSLHPYLSQTSTNEISEIQSLIQVFKGYPKEDDVNLDNSKS
jgi:hypothetical protein